MNDSQSPENTTRTTEDPTRPVKQAQGQLFSLTEGKAARDAGQNLAADNRKMLLSKAREVATTIAVTRPSRTVTADDVQKALIKLGHHPEELGNAAGSIFKVKNTWEADGFELSRRKTNHARRIVRWKYVGDVPQ